MLERRRGSPRGASQPLTSRLPAQPIPRRLGTHRDNHRASRGSTGSDPEQSPAIGGRFGASTHPHGLERGPRRVPPCRPPTSERRPTFSTARSQADLEGADRVTAAFRERCRRPDPPLPPNRRRSSASKPVDFDTSRSLRFFRGLPGIKNPWRKDRYAAAKG